MPRNHGRLVKADSDIEIVDGVIVDRGLMSPAQIGSVAVVAIGALAAGAVTVAAMRSRQQRSQLSTVTQLRR